jgi:hypothetical protein
MPRDIAGGGYSRMPFVPGSRNEGSSDRDWKQYIYILNISGTVFFVGGWCIFSMHPDPEMNRRSNGTTFEVRTSCPAVCRILTMKSNSTDLRRIFRVARNGIAPSQFVSYSDLSSASADIKAHRMGR